MPNMSKRSYNDDQKDKSTKKRKYNKIVKINGLQFYYNSGEQLYYTIYINVNKKILLTGNKFLKKVWDRFELASEIDFQVPIDGYEYLTEYEMYIKNMRIDRIDTLLDNSGYVNLLKSRTLTNLKIRYELRNLKNSIKTINEAIYQNNIQIARITVRVI